MDNVMKNIIETTILNEKFKWENDLSSRIPMIPIVTFEFKLVRMAFAMTIYNAQWQSLQVFGLKLENPRISHGQLYIVRSRVGKSLNLFVCASDRKTKHIMNRKALQ